MSSEQNEHVFITTLTSKSLQDRSCFFLRLNQENVSTITPWFGTLEHVSGQDEHAHWPKSYVSCWSFSFGVKPPWFWTGPTTFSWEENMCILTRTRFLMIFVDQGNKVQPLQDWSWPSWLKITTAPWFVTKSNTFSMFPDQDEHVHWPESNVFLVTALKFESLQDFAFVWKHD